MKARKYMIDDTVESLSLRRRCTLLGLCRSGVYYTRRGDGRKFGYHEVFGCSVFEDAVLRRATAVNDFATGRICGQYKAIASVDAEG